MRILFCFIHILQKEIQIITFLYLAVTFFLAVFLQFPRFGIKLNNFLFVFVLCFYKFAWQLRRRTPVAYL